MTSSSLGVGFELLSYVRHHFVGEANKMTPSGRLQSCVLVILTDAMVVCSHRGGVHRYIALQDLASITQLPRGRALFFVRGAHNILLSLPGYTKVIAILVQLHAGLSGAATGETLPVTTSDTMPALQTLNVRPSPHYISTVPQAVFQAISWAGVAQIRESVNDARRSLQGGSPALSKPAVVRTDPTNADLVPISADVDGISPRNTGGANPPRDFRSSDENGDGGSTVAPGNLDLSQRSFGGNTSTGGDGGCGSDGGNNNSFDGAAAALESSIRGVPLLTPMVERGGGCGALTFSSWKEQTAANNLSTSADMEDRLYDVTILVAINRGITMTFPALQSLWLYFCFVSAKLPGGQQSPSTVLHTVEDAQDIHINEALFHQTMQQFSESVPHTVTVRRGADDGDGLNFDSTLFWRNPVDLQLNL